jgi:hypothetical protein
VVDLPSISRRMAAVEPYAIEVVLSLSSLWAAWVLTSDPSNFQQTPKEFAVALRFGSEHRWAIVGLAAAIAKISGLVLCRTSWICTGLLLRLGGVAASGAFWFLLAISKLTGNPDSLFAFPVLCLALSAWWLLVRFPTLPSELKGSR